MKSFYPLSAIFYIGFKLTFSSISLIIMLNTQCIKVHL